MKRKALKKTSLFLGMALLSLASCSGSAPDGSINLRVLNCEDYIGDGVLEAFEAWEKETNGKNVKVIYDTFDTNETMLSSLKTGKSTYDLICPSDYAIQKMMSSGMLEPFDEDGTPNYDAYASPYLLKQMELITADDGSGEVKPIADYSRGYMWGTLGVLYNPEKVASDKSLDPEEVKYDMASWESLWDPKYNLEMSVKDSMRDTYSVGIMKTYGEDILKAMEESGDFDMETLSLLPGHYAHALDLDGSNPDAYTHKLAAIFNRCDEPEVKEVEQALMELKANVFGFEVDSGKDDIVKGLVGINLAWSGDAVYSMERGDNEGNNGEGISIYYSIPKTGGNIWFDGWVMPKSSSLHKEEAQEFVDFLSLPEVAAMGMDTIGYTSFIAGDTILDLIRQWYDPRTYAMYVYHDDPEDWEESDFVYDESIDPSLEEDYVDHGDYYSHGGNSYSPAGILLQDGSGEDKETGDDHGSHSMVGSTYEQAVVDGVPMGWEAYQELINSEAESEDDELAWSVRDLTYMFEGTLEEAPATLGGIPDSNPYLFYTDEIETIASPYEGGAEVQAGREFFAQYPEQDLIPKLAVMKDYGYNNKYVLSMWENVKGNNLPIWGVVMFSILLLALLAFLLAFVIMKARTKAIKVARRKEATKRIAGIRK